jgi:membrane protein
MRNRLYSTAGGKTLLLNLLISLKTWMRWAFDYLKLLFSALRQFIRDNGFFLSAGIAFNILVSMIPFLMLLLALIGGYLYKDEDVLNHIRHYLWNIAPGLDPGLTKTLFQVIKARNIVGLFGFIGLIWASTWIFGSLRIALNVVFRAEKGRSLVRGIGIDILMILVVGCLIFLSMTLTSLVTLIRNYQSLMPVTLGPLLLWILKYPIPLLFSYATFFLIYLILPNKKVHAKSAVAASLFTGVLWEFVKHFFGWYVVHLTRLPVIYGSLSTLIIFIFWIYYSAAILLIGGELAFLLEQKTINDQKNRRPANLAPYSENLP